MNITKLFDDKKYLDEEIQFFLTKKQIKKIDGNTELVKSHLKKARHNFEFFRLNKTQEKFNDWLLVVLYYSLYHCALALITNKGYNSKNHYATILVLIKEYPISKEEAKLIEKLSITKDDAQLYTDLKKERHDANYTTQLIFDNDTISKYESSVMSFINKTEEMIK